MADWGQFEITFNCKKEVFNSFQSILFKEYDGKLKLNFDSFIDDFDGDSTKYDSAFRFWIPAYFEVRDNSFLFYCKSLPLLKYLVIRISELIDCDFDAYINHPSYQCEIYYKIRNKKLKAKRVIGYEEYAYGNTDNIPFHEYKEDGFIEIEREIGYKRG